MKVVYTMGTITHYTG